MGLLLGAWLGARAARGVDRRTEKGEFDFLALMSHELKTPINVLLGYLELLADDVPEPLPASARAHVHHARNAARRMAELVNDLLTWTRLRAGRERIFHERVEAATIVENACVAARAQAEANGIRLETHVPPGLRIRTDPTKACHALRALISNAVKFTEKGVVRVRVEPAGERVRFRVRDTGIGIPAEHLETIFQPYWQVESSVRRERGGIGLGLTLSRELARLLGGQVSVRSRPGSGSEFVLELPVEPPAGPPGG